MKKYIKPVTINKEIFVAVDGTEFENESDCEDYEWDLNQSEKEKLASKIEYKINNFDLGFMINPYANCEYKWFKLKNDDDLKLFCNGYQAYCRSLKNIEIVKKYVIYPDYICLIDYPHGPKEPEWFTLSGLLEQTNVFMSQFPFDEEGNLI